MYLNASSNKYIDLSQKSIGSITNNISYGRLYNWYAVNDIRGIAPVGWHVPTQEEWITLLTNVGGSTVAGGKLKEAGLINWDAPNAGADNLYGFTLLPAGLVSSSTFMNLKTSCFLWTSTSQNVDNALLIQVYSDYASVYIAADLKKNGVSIRLIKDDESDPINVTIDGDVYDTVSIGHQVWLKENLAVTHYQNGDLIGSDFTGTIGAVTAYDNDESNVYKNINSITLFPEINGSILYDTILDNPIDGYRFNGDETLDPLDFIFPCEESLIQPIVDLCLKEIGIINGITRDTTNNASDDSSLPKQQN